MVDVISIYLLYSIHVLSFYKLKCIGSRYTDGFILKQTFCGLACLFMIILKYERDSLPCKNSMNLSRSTI